MKPETVLIVIGCLFTGGLAWGQQSTPPQWVWTSSPNGPVLVPLQAAAPAAAAQPEANAEVEADPKAAEAKEKEEEEKKKQERLKKIQAAKFDRTIGAILTAWAKPEEEEEKEEGEEAKADDKADQEKKEGDDAEEDKPEEEEGEEKEATDPAETDELAEGIKQWQMDVTLGNWDAVKAFLEGLSEEEAKAGYTAMLNSLKTTAPAVIPELDPALAQQLARIRVDRKEPEPNFFTFDDIIGLIGCAPGEMEKETVPNLAALLRIALKDGNQIEALLVRLEEEVAKPEEEAILTQREAARLIASAGQPRHLGRFLPDFETAEAEGDHEALNYLAIHYRSLYYQDRTSDYMDQAWKVTQAVLASQEVEKEDKTKALNFAVSIAPQIEEEYGKTWMEETFTDRPERGMEVLRALGAAPPDNLQNRPTDTSTRYRDLKLQGIAVEALLEAAPEKAGDWSATLHMLAMNWYREAEFSDQYDYRNTYGPQMRRDSYGNIYYADENQQYVQNRVQPISAKQMLEIVPSGAWLQQVEASMQPSFDSILAQLYLKVGKEDEAFPHIEKLAPTHPELAESLVNEFLRVWTNNHDPNANRNRTSYYMYMYGYERKAESIPLTRSKQERNLKELAEVVKRLRALPLEDLDERLLTRAFTTCHSSAEVYRLEAIESVFGSLDALEPEILAELTQQMRANLAGVWRSPAEQQDKKTKRKQQDIQMEVLRGYEVCRKVTEAALKKYPEQWQLLLVQAAIQHDENNYYQELDPDSGFAEKRLAALDGFAKAAKAYEKAAKDLPENEQSARLYEMWYYASLGACDLGFVKDDMVADTRQPAKIRAAMEALGGETSERHLGFFANSLFTRMSAAKPAVKYRYLKGGFEIVGDHEKAEEAKAVFDYYKDLVTELKLVAEIDGSDTVGHGQPFGVFVNLRHTKEIERESGGFGRYLQNQNSGGYYYYNYGRPLQNYREKFEEIVRQAMEEQFEILSVTFQREDVNSRAVQPYGWRETPYAYILLKAKGPKVDQLPSVRLDLDFLDTSGYAVLPIESPLVPIDAAPAKGDPRPVQNLTITQTLDERQAADGKLILEVVANGNGLIPELEDLLDLEPLDFQVTDIQDQGISVSQFDFEAPENVVKSERSWMITLAAAEGMTTPPQEFAFAQPVMEGGESEYQRYVDADLMAVDPVVNLEEHYAQPDYSWVSTIVAVVLVACFGGIALARVGKRPVEQKSLRYPLPENVTPFTVLGLLKQIQRDNGFSNGEQEELAASIHQVESYYFTDEPEGEEPPLRSIAEQWVLKAS